MANAEKDTKPIKKAIAPAKPKAKTKAKIVKKTPKAKGAPKKAPVKGKSPSYRYPDDYASRLHKNLSELKSLECKPVFATAKQANFTFSDGSGNFQVTVKRIGSV